ncbi:DUF3558 domain-containing protein [Nocardia blacklockiae]|uniref:DUF3558 domain-containing protein n=1 Tax=Nocardia blacklockiae TaxID=480036 RepID=UPI001895FF8D|nr:DUF3558 domain-containing protein [Nocardia blacklockiae]MBF6173742.1 DUF3558 domain-containing protein [Nocardia blacklockiae]
MTRRLAVVLLAVMVPVLGACNDGDGGDAPGSATTTAEAKLWDPCTQIPDDVLQRAGVNPAAKESGIAGVHQHGWEICNWKGKRYTVTVFSGSRPLQEIETKPGNVDFEDVVIAGRSGRQYRVEGASKNDTCDVAFSASQGVFEIMVGNSLIVDNPGDPCVSLREVGNQIVPLLPQ